MKLLFKHKHYQDLIVDKDLFNKNHSFNICKYDNKTGTTETLTYTLMDILNSDNWDVIPENALTHEELDRLHYMLYREISLHGDQYCLSNTLNKINELMCIYDIDGMNILS